MKKSAIFWGPPIFLSLFFHCLFILLLIFGLKNSVKDFKNLTYVTLIQEAGNTLEQATTENQTTKETSQKKEIFVNSPKQEKQEIPQKSTEKTKKQEDENLLRERIAALQAKKRILERAQKGSLQPTGQKSIKGEGVSSSYLSLISGLIRHNWNIPDTVPKNLEAVVSVRILPDGQVIIEGFEKHSGNALFDSSVLKAIKNSSPLPPPKNEVVVGLRFKP